MEHFCDSLSLISETGNPFFLTITSGLEAQSCHHAMVLASYDNSTTAKHDCAQNRIPAGQKLRDIIIAHLCSRTYMYIIFVRSLVTHTCALYSSVEFVRVLFHGLASTTL